MDKELKPFWNRLFGFNWKFGFFLILIVCIPRFILVLNANSSGSYGSIGLIMTISAIVPFLFLTKYGRTEIGITKPKNSNGYFTPSFSGLLQALFFILLVSSFMVLPMKIGINMLGSHIKFLQQ